MGWCSGSEWAEQLWKRIEKHIPLADKQELAQYIYDFFFDNDADCWWYSIGSVRHVAYPDGTPGDLEWGITPEYLGDGNAGANNSL